ncbi:MAG TPA: hypothetical protein VKB73_00670 [Gaiellaceae bacterium]|nr:hypothetical protein [Gaiellaceae bacterium]
MLLLYITARIAFFLLMLAYFVQGFRRLRSGTKASAVFSFVGAFAFLLLSGLLAII